MWEHKNFWELFGMGLGLVFLKLFWHCKAEWIKRRKERGKEDEAITFGRYMGRNIAKLFSHKKEQI
jgi:hypothetical protein